MASIAAGAPFGFALVVIFQGINNYLVDSYTIYAASCLAGTAVLRSAMAAAFPLFTNKMFERLERRFERMERLLENNTDALEAVALGLSIYRRSDEVEEEDEEEQKKSEKAKGKRKQK